LQSVACIHSPFLECRVLKLQLTKHPIGLRFLQKSPIIRGCFTERDLQLTKHPIGLRYPAKHHGMLCKLQVSFRKAASNYRALLQKETRFTAISSCTDVSRNGYQNATKYRVAKTHRMPTVAGHFLQKRTINSRALGRKMTFNDKASYGSSPPCILNARSRSLFKDLV